MFDKHLRHTKDSLLIPLADSIGERLDPTLITVVGGGVGLLAAAACWHGMTIAALGLWALNRTLDGLDGTVARRYEKTSDFGGYVDVLIDHIVYAAVPAGLALAQPDTPGIWLALVFMLATFYINGASWMMLSSIMEKRKLADDTEGTTVTMTTGLIEGAETVFFYALFFVLPGCLPHLYVIFGVLVIVTIVQRLVWAQRHLR